RLPVGARYHDPLALGICHAESGLIPRHVRVVPFDPAEPFAIGVKARGRDEIGTAHQHLWRRWLSRGQADDLVAHVGHASSAGMVLPDADDPLGVGADIAVGVAVALGALGLGREGADATVSRIAPVKPLVLPGGVPDDAVADPPGAAAVLVDGRSGVGVAREKL